MCQYYCHTYNWRKTVIHCGYTLPSIHKWNKYLWYKKQWEIAKEDRDSMYNAWFNQTGGDESYPPEPPYLPPPPAGKSLCLIKGREIFRQEKECLFCLHLLRRTFVVHKCSESAAPIVDPALITGVSVFPGNGQSISTYSTAVSRS